MKIVKWLKEKLPISRKTYYKDMEAIKTTVDGIIQSEKQHSQIEMNLVKNVDAITLANQMKKAAKAKNEEDDVAFR